MVDNNLKEIFKLGKKIRCRKAYKSKNERKNVSNSNIFDTYDAFDRAIFKAQARQKGKRVCETIENPNKQERNKQYIRVCTNG